MIQQLRGDLNYYCDDNCPLRFKLINVRIMGYMVKISPSKAKFQARFVLDNTCSFHFVCPCTKCVSHSTLPVFH